MERERERKPLYSIFPAPPSGASSQTTNQTSTQQKGRQSTESRNRPSLDQSPYPPPQTPLPPVPNTSHAAPHTIPPSPHQPLPPTPDSLRPVRLPVRRKTSPNREFADFQRELAQSSHRQPSPHRGRPTSPRQRPPSKQSSHHPSSQQSSHQTSSRQSKAAPDPSDHDMQRSTLSTSSSSSFDLSKPPLLSPSTTVAPTPATSMGGRDHRKTVYFHGSIGGAGNYRKVIRENKRAPRAYAENAEPIGGRRSSPTRFLSNLFGNQRGGERVGNIDEKASAGAGSEDSVREREEVDLGAAENLRRKMLGVGRKKKGDRS